MSVFDKLLGLDDDDEYYDDEDLYEDDYEDDGDHQEMLDLFHKLGGKDSACICDLPQRLKIRLLGAAFDHCKMAARKSAKPAEYLLREAAFFSESSDDTADSVAIIFYHGTHSFHRV